MGPFAFFEINETVPQKNYFVLIVRKDNGAVYYYRGYSEVKQARVCLKFFPVSIY